MFYPAWLLMTMSSWSAWKKWKCGLWMKCSPRRTTRNLISCPSMLKVLNFRSCTDLTSRGIGPQMILIEDHLENLSVHRHLAQAWLSLGETNGCQQLVCSKRATIPHDHMEGTAEIIFSKMFLGLPFRKIRLSRRRRKHHVSSAA